jgi:hypothetical protein
MTITRKKWIFVIELIILVALLGVLWHMASPKILNYYLKQSLDDALQADCVLENVRIRPLGDLRVEGARLYLEGYEGAVVEAGDVRVEVGWWRMITGRYPVRSVQVRNVTFELRPDVIQWAEGLDRGFGRPSETEERSVMNLPRITVEDGTVIADLPQLTGPVVAKHLRGSLAPGVDGGVSGRGVFSVAGSRFSFHLNASGSGGGTVLGVETAGADIGSLLPFRGVLPDMWHEVTPSGRVAGSMEVHFNGQGGDIVIGGEAYFTQVAVNDPFLPAPLTDLEGDVKFRSHSLSISNASGRLGDARVRIENAEVDIASAGSGSFYLTGIVRGLDPASMRRGGCPGYITAFLDEVGISSGVADADFDIYGSLKGRPDVRGRVVLRVPEIRPVMFPLSLKNVRANIQVYSLDSFQIKDARAKLLGGVVDLSGFVWRSQGGWVPELQLNLNNVSFTEDQIDKIPSGLRSVVNRLGVKRALVRGDVVLQGDDVVVDGRLRDVILNPRDFPYRFENVSAEVRWSVGAQKVELRGVVAQHGKGIVTGSATIRMDDKTFDATIAGDNIPIDDALRDVLPADVQRVWDEVRPEGYLDLNLGVTDLKLPGDEGFVSAIADHADAVVKLRNVELSPRGSEIKCRNLQGTIGLDGESLQFKDMTGSIMGVPVTVHGQVPINGGDYGLRIIFRSARMRLQPALLRHWPKRLRSRIESVSAGGDFELQGEIRGGEAEDGVVVECTFLFYGLSAVVRERKVEATGELSVNVLRALDDKGRKIEGHLRLQRFGVGPFWASDLIGAASLSEGIITMDRSDMSLYGGRLTVEEGKLDINNLNWSLKANLFHLDVESLMVAMGIEGANAPAGFARINVDISGRGMRKSLLSGEGEIKVDRGRLYNLPMIMKVLKLFDLGLPRESPVTYAYGEFRLDRGVFYLDNALLAGGTVPIHIQGTVGLESEVPLEMQPVDLVYSIPRQKGILDSIPVINWIKHLTIDQVRGLLMQARARGTIGDYEITTVLTPVVAPIGSIWQLLDKLSPTQKERYTLPQ